MDVSKWPKTGFMEAAMLQVNGRCYVVFSSSYVQSF